MAKAWSPLIPKFSTKKTDKKFCSTVLHESSRAPFISIKRLTTSQKVILRIHQRLITSYEKNLSFNLHNHI